MITSAVLALVLLTGSVWLVAAHAVAFLLGAVARVRHIPHGLMFRYLVRYPGRPRPGPPANPEESAPPHLATWAAGAVTRGHNGKYTQGASTMIAPPHGTATFPLAQAVGASFGALAVVGFLAGVGPLGYAAVGMAFAAVFTAVFADTVFNFYPGCQTYLFVCSTPIRGANT